MRPTATSIFQKDILKQAVIDSVKKLDPRSLVKNPVMFVTECCALLTTAAIFQKNSGEPKGFIVQISLWLWFTVLFANFAEAVAEGRGKAQADSLRKTRSHTMANRLQEDQESVPVPAEDLRKNDLVTVSAGEIIPADGEVISGIATVDESAITGESAPVIRESGGDRSAVTGGTRVLSDQIIVRVTANPGESFLDRMISLVEGANRQKTPNEIALTILLVRAERHFSGGDLHLEIFRDLLRGIVQHHRPGIAPGLSPADDHRRAAERHRHRRHRPPGAKERPGHERQGGGSGGRHRRASAGQDRHHHPGRPAGGALYPGARGYDRNPGRHRPVGLLGR